MAGDSQTQMTQFLSHLVNEKRMSDHTVTAYQRDLKRCEAWMETQQIRQWETVKSQHIRQWMAELNRSGMSSRSIQRALSSLRSLFRYLIREGKVSQNPAQSVQSPKIAKRLPSTLDVDQVSGLLDPINQDTFIGCRDRALMELLYSSGLRLAELAQLDCRDVDMADRLIYVTGKGNKERVVPIGGQAIDALATWQVHRQQYSNVDQTALFISKRGGRLGQRAIQKRLQYWGEKHGISEHVHPHRLRHAFASHMLESSGDLRAVQELLGHADIATTQIYTHVDFQQLAKVYDAAHPRAKK